MLRNLVHVDGRRKVKSIQECVASEPHGNSKENLSQGVIPMEVRPVESRIRSYKKE